MGRLFSRVYSCIDLFIHFIIELWYLAPVIPGHEIVGRILKFELKITEFQVGVKSYIELFPTGRRRVTSCRSAYFVAPVDSPPLTPCTKIEGLSDGQPVAYWIISAPTL